MKALVTLSFAVSLSLASFAAHAASCTEQSGEKKLAGAAKTSFMKKCEKDAGAACDLQAKDKKLSGAAKNSFTNKCKTDAVGS